MTQTHHVQTPAGATFSAGDKIVFNGVAHRWQSGIETCHILVDVITREVTAFSARDVRRLIAEGEMIIYPDFYAAPS